MISKLSSCLCVFVSLCFVTSFAQAPSELIEMIASFNGPLSERPFVPPIDHPAIGYGVRLSNDPIAKLMRDVQEGKTRLKFEGPDGYLHSVLDALKIPVESQIAVFSKDSVQRAIISPENPRMLYFNDSVAVGTVRGGFIEIASQDPELGIQFYMLLQQPGAPFFLRRNDCLQCHLSRNSLDVPGMLMRSVYPAPDGSPINPLGSHLLDHRTQFEQRWGGWYVSGAGAMKHMGNRVVSNPTSAESMSTIPEKVKSDVVALMVFEHQMHMMNLLTRVGWEFRMAQALERESGKRNEKIARQLQQAVAELVDYLLFIDEPRLPSKIDANSEFALKFASLGPLRQFDLERRLMRYPCSYMIYSPTFDALPADAKKSIYARMREVMNAKFSSNDRESVTKILQETKKDF